MAVDILVAKSLGVSNIGAKKKFPLVYKAVGKK